MAPAEPAAELHLNEVVHTATALVADRLAPREAVTVLAPLIPRARARAQVLANHDPGRAGAFAELFRSLASALGSQISTSDDPRDLAAVIDDLDSLARALAAPPA